MQLAPLMCKGGSPPFQQLTAVSMSQLILEDEVRQREDELDPVKQLKQVRQSASHGLSFPTVLSQPELYLGPPMPLTMAPSSSHCARNLHRWP